MEGGGKVRGMKEILAAIDEGGERGLDLSDAVCTSVWTGLFVIIVQEGCHVITVICIQGDPSGQ